MWKKPSRLLSVILCLLAACTTLQDHDSSTPGERNPEKQEIPESLSFLHSKKPPCLEMVRKFCDKLYSPENQGSMSFTVGTTNFDVKMGRTENDFLQKDYEFMKSKLTGWKRFPRDLRASLNSHEFSRKLRQYLSRTSPQKMTLQNRMRTLRDEDELSFIWNLAVKEVVLSRMEKQYPGYSRIQEDLVPLELKYEAQRLGRMLKAEIAIAIWSNHPNWKMVESRFEKIKKTYVDEIQSSKQLPADLQQKWMNRVESVRLIVPGSDPQIDMEDCYKNESNAYYFREKNEITVCAGDFNTEEIDQTLAHELAHALDLGRSRYLFQRQSKFGNHLEQIKEKSCSSKAFSCQDWDTMKESFGNSLAEFQTYKADLPEFNTCLQDKALKTPIPDEYLTRIAKENVDETLADLAQMNIFLRVISPKIPLMNGSSQKNPMYLNPCAYYLWQTQAHPFEDDMSLLLFFTAEYRCSKEPVAAVRFKIAIDRAKDLQEQFVQAKVGMEGVYSERERLVTDGYSVSPAERFADAIGQRVFSRILAAEQDMGVRRARYLFNNAWLCRKPSLQKLFPAEARVQKNYYVEPHSEIVQRQKELLPDEIQEVLQCRQDFESHQCVMGDQ
ncbi:MAG: hypothetical protein COT73_03165 [Bdellovibrio sp. CG10_big_fil_rev_8_21_14_0_10_47_8]|nr:MAG: hypothetical protein COT73_03165 [Bdellovibrio sp. CG10_big_fil_rev_8_21_14_0_10_47_8]